MQRGRSEFPLVHEMGNASAAQIIPKLVYICSSTWMATTLLLQAQSEPGHQPQCFLWFGRKTLLKGS